jgi:hypothetical protein
MVEIVWTDSAIQDLNDIGEYIAKDSIRYAEITVFICLKLPTFLKNFH